jgi:hypothetical protein
MPNIRVVRTNTTVDVAAIGIQCASGNNNGAAMLNAEKVVLVNTSIGYQVAYRF